GRIVGVSRTADEPLSRSDREDDLRQVRRESDDPMRDRCARRARSAAAREKKDRRSEKTQGGDGGTRPSPPSARGEDPILELRLLRGRWGCPTACRLRRTSAGPLSARSGAPRAGL